MARRGSSQSNASIEAIREENAIPRPVMYDKVDGKKEILIGCRVPNGFLIEDPAEPKNTVRLLGSASELIIGSGYGLTKVDGPMWERFKQAHKAWPPLVNKILFECTSPAEAAKIAGELDDEETGFEPMEQNSGGVKTATEDK